MEEILCRIEYKFVYFGVFAVFGAKYNVDLSISTFPCGSNQGRVCLF